MAGAVENVADDQHSPARRGEQDAVDSGFPHASSEGGPGVSSLSGTATADAISGADSRRRAAGAPATATDAETQRKDAARRAAMAAAMAAVKYAAPGQRERVINEAMSAAANPASVPAEVVPISAGRAAQEKPAKPQLEPAAELGTVQTADGAYVAPPWGEAPPEDDAPTLDVMKTGTILDSIALPAARGYATFGRHSATDVLVEHPSASRLHAVLQFRGRQAYLADCGSTHGTFLNRDALAPWQYYALHVGAQFRFGQSTRSYIFSASEDWQTAEGPNREVRRRQRQEAAVRAAAAAAAARDRKASEEAMRAALHGNERFGQGPDAQGDGDEDEEAVDWRARFDSGLLSTKQMKTAEAIRSKEFKIQRMQEDARRIRDKEADQGELTAGQAAALLNCERGCDKLREEAEELEETLQDSLRDAAAGRRAAGKLEVRDTRKRRQRERGDSDSDDDRDDFYDRTRPKGKVAKAGGEKMALTVETLCARLHEREAEAAALAEKIAQARASSTLERDRDQPATEALDSFMQGVAAESAEEGVRRLEHQARLTQEQIKQVTQLLDIADPSRDHRKRLQTGK